MRLTLKIKNSQGYAIGHPRYGYKYDEIDKKRWTIDEEAADVVRHIFDLRKHGESMNGIAKILKKEKVYIPSVYAMKKGLKKPLAKPPLGEYLWTHVMVRNIMYNQSYVGDVINFKTYNKSFKLKKRLENDKENWQIHKPDNHYFLCQNNRARNGLSKKTQHIRVDVLTELVKNDIANIVRFATEFGDEFVKIVVDEDYKSI